MGSKSADLTDTPRSSADHQPPVQQQDSDRSGQRARSAGSLSLARLCSEFVTFSEDYLERDDIFNTCDELNDYLLNDLTE